MPISLRAVALPSITAVAVVGLILGTGAMSATADAPPSLSGSIDNSTLTLPIGDGFMDSSTVTVSSSAPDPVTVHSSGALDGATIDLARDTADSDYSGSLDLGTLFPTASRYEIVIAQDGASTDLGAVWVGSGQVETVTVTPNDDTIYSDEGTTVPLESTVVATDERGTALPISGHWNFASADGENDSQGDFATTTSPTPIPAINVAGYAAGDVQLTVAVEGPADTSPVTAATRDVVIATIPKLTGVTIAADAGTIYPEPDGYRDQATFTVRPQAGDSPFYYSTVGTVVISQGSKTVASLPFNSNTVTPSTVTWTGRTNGKIVAGSFLATVTLTAYVNGSKITVTNETGVTVSTKKLVKTTKSVTQTAAAFFAASHAASPGSNSSLCKTSGSSLACTSKSSATSGASRNGYLPISTTIQDSGDVKPFAAKLTFVVTKDTFAKGKATYDWTGESSSTPKALKKGTISTSTYPYFGDGVTTIDANVVVAGKGALTISKVTTTFTYYALK
jgi:hypothetical protein